MRITRRFLIMLVLAGATLAPVPPARAQMGLSGPPAGQPSTATKDAPKPAKPEVPQGPKLGGFGTMAISVLVALIAVGVAVIPSRRTEKD
ncbi:MAG: hypothetical protein IBJ11_10315 [Phycisphaerales bacterium]|nr:hypothetical protein [Phycisphaerales bacterium]